LYKNYYTLPAALTIVIVIVICAFGYSPVKTLTLHVALSGDDRWSGTLPYPDKLNTNGPLRTLNQACQYIQKEKSRYQLIQVFIHEGNYFIDNELVFSGIKTGADEAEVIIQAYRGDLVCLSGAFRQEQINLVNDQQILKGIHPKARNRLFSADLNMPGLQRKITLDNTGPSIMIIHNGVPMKLCQYPDDGWLVAGSVKGSASTGITVDYVDKEQGGPEPDRNTFLYGYWKFDWAGGYQKIKAYHAVKKEIELSPPYHSYGYGENQRFRFCNVLSALDEPNEYYIDFEQNKIIFWPKDTLRVLEIVLNAGAENKFNFINARSVTIRNICFENFYGPVIDINNSQKITLRNCKIRNIVTSAVKIEGGKENGLDSCELYNIGASGIVMSGGNRRSLEKGENFVSHTRIHDFAQIDKTYQPAIYISGAGQLVSHNHIYNGPHQGIRIIGNDHCIEYNELDHLVQETGDAGAVYMGRDWTFRGNLFQYNYFHDLKGPGKYGAIGIYLDDAASGSTVFGNVFMRCNKGIQIGGGRDNLVCNNVFLYCYPAVKIDNRGETDAKSAMSVNGSWKMYDKLKAVSFDTPPYSLTYPKLKTILEDNPSAPAGNSIVDNVSYKSEFIVRKPDNDSYWNKILMLDNNLSGFNEPSDTRNNDASLIRFVIKQALGSNDDFKPLPLDEIGIHGN
jgi:hypothetical protein